MLHAKTEIDGLYKDKESGGLINKDNEGLKAYKQQKMRAKKALLMEKRIETLEQEVAALKEIILNGVQR